MLTSCGFTNIKNVIFKLEKKDCWVDSNSEDRKLVSIYVELKKGLKCLKMF